MIGLTNSFGNNVMDSRPVTLGDWYAILKLEDYVEAATNLNRQKTPPPWLSTYLLQWAPEVIVQRDLTSANVSREESTKSNVESTAPSAGSRYRTKSPPIVSSKREYSRTWPETFGSWRPKIHELGGWRRNRIREKPPFSALLRAFWEMQPSVGMAG
jgi:hypothetical protein